MTANGWQSTTFAKLIDEGLLHLSDGYRAKNHELGGSGPIFLRAGHVSDSHVDFGGVERFHESLYDRLVPKLSQPGDVVITTKGNSTGRVTYVTPAMPQFVYSPHLSFWRSLNRDIIEPGYLRYWSRSAEFRRQLDGYKVSTDMAPYISLIDQKRLSITLPSIFEQRRIAGILSALDDKIELNRRMNETLEDMARAIFKSWFVDFGPVHAKAAGRQPAGMDAVTAALFPSDFENSPLGPVPAGWSTTPLYETAKYINGAAFKSHDFCATGIGLPVVKIAELKDGVGTQTKWSHRAASNEQLIDSGDLLYSWSGSPDTSLDAFIWSNGPGLLNQHIFKVVTPTNARKRYVYYLLKNLRPTLVEMARNKQTTGLGHVTVADMRRLLVCEPPVELQTAFDNRIASIFDRAFENSLETKILTSMRDTLLPKLLSGQLRIPDAEALLETA